MGVWGHASAHVPAWGRSGAMDVVADLGPAHLVCLAGAAQLHCPGPALLGIPLVLSESARGHWASETIPLRPSGNAGVPASLRSAFVCGRDLELRAGGVSAGVRVAVAQAGRL